jgi:hypothetical protein
VHPFHCLLAKLSLVRITPFLRYQRNIFIFKGILAFQVQQLKCIPFLITRSLYMFFTEKFLLAVQIKESWCSLSWIVRILPTRRNQLALLGIDP